MSNRNAITATLLALSCGALAACSGGGGTPPTASPASPSTITPAHVATATPAPTATPAATATPSSSADATVSGTVVNLPYNAKAAHSGYSVLSNGSPAKAGAPIAGAQVYVGPSVLSGASAPSAVPAGFLAATTNSDGAFTLANVPVGHLAITIFAAPPHITILHQDLIVSAPATAAGAYYMTVLSDPERAWFAQENRDRAGFDVAPTVLDESVVESARYWAQFMQANDYFAHCIPASRCVSGDTTPPPASYGPQDVDPQHRYAYFHGFSGGAEGENIAGGFGSWQSVDSTFMAEQSQCPNSSPTNCPFNEKTGHFLNIVDANYVWTGLGISTANGVGPFYDQEFSLLESSTPSSTSAAERRGMQLAR